MENDEICKAMFIIVAVAVVCGCCRKLRDKLKAHKKNVVLLCYVWQLHKGAGQGQGQLRERSRGRATAAADNNLTLDCIEQAFDI